MTTIHDRIAGSSVYHCSSASASTTYHGLYFLGSQYCISTVEAIAFLGDAIVQLCLLRVGIPQLVVDVMFSSGARKRPVETNEIETDSISDQKIVNSLNDSIQVER